MMSTVYLADSITVLNTIKDNSIDLIYIDPPFGTGLTQISRPKIDTRIFGQSSYVDTFTNYVEYFLPYLVAFNRTLKDTGTLYVHLDYHWVHYVKVELDDIFGRDNFLNEIVWSYNFGGRGKDRWPAKHDTILVYVKQRGKHTFNWDSIPRIPYKAPELQYVGRSREDAEKRIELGQVPTDVWDMNVIGTNSKERTGYPTQKPMRLLERVIKASSNPGDVVLDAFAGSGTTGVTAASFGREFIMIDKNPDAIRVIEKRLSEIGANYELCVL
jgi:site-specific DNA-methyltransferase (adenine-specific)